jgi:hypothetical protein
MTTAADMKLAEEDDLGPADLLAASIPPPTTSCRSSTPPPSST